MPKEIPTDQLLQVYRHAKGTLYAVEQILMDRKVIDCPKCGTRHTSQEPHYEPKRPVLSMVFTTAEVSG